MNGRLLYILILDISQWHNASYKSSPTRLEYIRPVGMELTLLPPTFQHRKLPSITNHRQHPKPQRLYRGHWEPVSTQMLLHQSSFVFSLKLSTSQFNTYTQIAKYYMLPFFWQIIPTKKSSPAVKSSNRDSWPSWSFWRPCLLLKLKLGNLMV